MAVFDDGRDWDAKLVVYHGRIDWTTGEPELPLAEAVAVPVAPAEPLALECRHFVDCVAAGRRPYTDGAEGMRVLRVLSAAEDAIGAAIATPGRTAAPGSHAALGSGAAI